jgi:hypothetical protein
MSRGAQTGRDLEGTAIEAKVISEFDDEAEDLDLKA